MLLCSKNNLPVPRIASNKCNHLISETMLDGTKHFVVVFQFLAGKEINRFNSEKLIAVARLQAKMHFIAKQNNTWVERPIDGHLGHENWLQSIINDFTPTSNKELFAKYLELAKIVENIIKDPKLNELKTLLIHGDVHEGNMRFIGNNISGLFDFDDCRRSIVSEDIGMFLSVILRHGDIYAMKKKVKAYFSAYEEVLPLSNFEKRISLYFAIEKRLVHRINDLKKDILRNKVDVADYDKVLKQLKRILNLLEEIK